MDKTLTSSMTIAQNTDYIDVIRQIKLNSDFIDRKDLYAILGIFICWLLFTYLLSDFDKIKK